MACPDEIQDCDLMKLSSEQLFKKALRQIGECLALSVKNQLIYTELISQSTTVSETLPAGTLTATFTTSDDFTGEINGVSREPGAYTFNPPNGKNPAIPYIITTGSLTIDYYIESIPS